MNPVLFYAESDSFGEFSSWWPAEIEVDGKRWPTTEHYFMAQKTKDKGERERIRKAPTPRRAKELGRAVRLWKEWDGMKFEVMLVANRRSSPNTTTFANSCSPPKTDRFTRTAKTLGGVAVHTSRRARTCSARCSFECARS